MNCILTKDGKFKYDGDLDADVSLIFDRGIELEEGCTWDSLMLAVLRNPTAFDILCKSSMYGYNASDLAQEYNDLLGKVDIVEDVIKLKFQRVLDISEHYDYDGDYEMELFISMDGLSSVDDERYSMSMSTPAAMAGIPIEIDTEIRSSCIDSLKEVYPVLRSDFTVRDIFCTAFNDMSFHGIGLVREENRISFISMIKDIEESIVTLSQNDDSNTINNDEDRS